MKTFKKINALVIACLLSTMALFMTSCEQDDVFQQAETATSDPLLAELPDSIPTVVEQYKPSLKSTGTKTVSVFVPNLTDPITVEAEVINGNLIAEGDIFLGTEKDLRNEKATIVIGANKRWPSGIIPYVIKSGHPSSTTIQNAINHINNNTNLWVVPRTNEADYIEFIVDDGCWSAVGRQGGKQNISIDGCSFGSTVHEILHAAGLWHEQSRCDRNSHVTIHWDNIIEAKKHNFNQHCIDGQDFGNYNFNSIMHYGEYAFSKNNQKTITVKNGNATIGQRTSMSAGDINAINAMYTAPYNVPANIAGIGIAGSNDKVYTWYKNGKVTVGKSNDLDFYQSAYNYTLPPGKSYADIVGIAIAGSNDKVYTWYKDGKVSCGTSNDLDKYAAPYNYSLPPGKTPNDIVGIGIAGSNDHVYVWFKDYKVSSGTSNDLDKYAAPYNYTLPAGKTPAQIVGMDIAGSTDYVYTWFIDNKVSTGTSNDLDKYKTPYWYR